MKRTDVVTMLHARVIEAGSLRSYAKSVSVPEATVRRAVGGKEPGPAVLRALGLRRVERYEVVG